MRAYTSLAAGIILAVALLEIVAIIVGRHSIIGSDDGLLLIPFLPIALARARGITLWLSGFSFALAVFLMPSFAGWRGVLQETAPFVAFLATIQILRAAAELSPAIAEVRARLNLVATHHQQTVVEFGALLLGAVLANGAHPILAAAVHHDAASEADQPAGRREFALSALRGVCLASLWSPFFLALPFLSAHLPAASFVVLVVGGLIACGSLLAVDLFLNKIGGHEIGIIARTLAPLAPAIITLTTLVIAGVILLGLSPLAATTIAVPVMVGLQMVISRQAREQGMARQTAVQTWLGLGTINDEILLLASALGLARAAIAHGDWMAGLGGSVAEFSPSLVLLGAALWVIIGGLVGLHPMLTSVLAMSAAHLVPALSTTALAGTLLASWGFATMVSPASITVLVAAQMFRTPTGGLVLSPNLTRAILSGLVCAVLYGVANSLVGPLQLSRLLP